MDRKHVFNIVLGMVFGAIIGASIGPILGNNVLGALGGVLGYAFIGWFIAAAVCERTTRKQDR